MCSLRRWCLNLDQLQVVCTDLRGYGASSKPAFEGDKSHAGYSKREMAKDNVEVMSRLGFSKFFVCAHDRGARVTHRMLLDYADVVEKAILLDIAPTLTMYEDTNLEFATAYYHWFFLIQPAPFPELLLSTNPSAYLYRSFAREGEPGPSNPALKKFSKAALDRYEAAISSPGTIHAICEDYRASATIDLVYDREDRSRGKKIKTPLKVFWGGKGIIGKLWEPLRAWEAVSEPGYVKGGREITQSGHFIPEEAPDDIMAEILHFFMEK